MGTVFLDSSPPALPKNFGALGDAPFSFVNFWRVGPLSDRFPQTPHTIFHTAGNCSGIKFRTIFRYRTSTPWVSRLG